MVLFFASLVSFSVCAVAVVVVRADFLVLVMVHVVRVNRWLGEWSLE